MNARMKMMFAEKPFGHPYTIAAFEGQLQHIIWLTRLPQSVDAIDLFTHFKVATPV